VTRNARALWNWLTIETLHLDLSNCYGIKKLEADFDFAQHKAYAIYAPNGAMKSSLAHTFKDLADGVASKDVIFPTRVSSRTIADETGTEIPKDQVLVVAPYDEVLGHTDSVSEIEFCTLCCSRTMNLGLHLAVHARKKSFLRHTAEKTSTLLVDTKLRKEYEALHVEIAKAKDIFIKVLKEQSKSKCRAALISRNMFWRAV
jgi:hypothetical protein